MRRILGFLILAMCFLQSVSSAAEDSLPKLEDFKAILQKLEYYTDNEKSDSLTHYLYLAEKTCAKFNTGHQFTPEELTLGSEIYLSIARHSILKNLILEAIINYSQAERLAVQAKNEHQLAKVLSKKGNTYLFMGSQIKAIESFRRATLLYEQLNEPLALAECYLSLATIYKNLKKVKLALENIERALAINKELKSSVLLGKIKIIEAEMMEEMEEYEEALKLYQSALSLSKTVGNNRDGTSILNRIGLLYLKNNQLRQSIHYLEEAYSIALEKGYAYELAHTLINLGEYHFNNGSFEEAIKHGKEALSRGEVLKNDDIKNKAATLLLNIYKKNNDWKNSFYYQELLIKEKEKNESKIIGQIIEEETHRMNLEKEKLLSEQKKVEKTLLQEREKQGRKIIYIIAATVILLLLTFVFLFYSRLKASKEKNKIILKQSEERKLLLQEVHHRVKNNFQIVSSMLRLQSYSIENEELRQSFTEAVNRINSMAMVHEVIYQQEKFKDLDIKVYLQKLVEILQKTSYNNIHFVTESESVPLKIETLISVGIALNELITNSFKHAFNLEVYNPMIKISIRVMNDNQVLLVYQDNGVGINKEQLKHNFGMELIETIIENYSGSLTIVDDNEEWPTTIEIRFKE